MSTEPKPPAPVDPTTEDAATQPPRSRTEPAADATVRDAAQVVAEERAQAAEAPVYVEPGRPAQSSHEDSTTHLNLARHPPAPSGPVARFLALPTAARGLIVAAVGGAVVVGVIALLLPSARPAPAQAGPSEAERLAQLMAEGQAALQQKQYGVAVAAFEAVAHLAPGNTEAPRLLAQATRARDDEAHLEDARRALEGKRFDEARLALASLAPDSALAEPAKALAEQLRSGEAEALLAQGDAQVRAGQLDEARATQARLQPLDAASAEKLATEIAAPPAPGTPPAPGAPASAPRPGADPELAPALAAFATDASAGAQALEKLAQAAKSPAARKRAEALAPAAKACAQAAASLKTPTADATELVAALPRCVEVDPEAAPTRALREALTALYAKQAYDGLAAEDKPKAAQAYRRMLALEPGDAQAQQELQKLVEQAHERYLGAYVLSEKDPDAAAKQLQEVLGVLAPQDADYAKARAKLTALRPGR